MVNRRLIVVVIVVTAVDCCRNAAVAAGTCRFFLLLASLLYTKWRIGRPVPKRTRGSVQVEPPACRAGLAAVPSPFYNAHGPRQYFVVILVMYLLSTVITAPV